MIGSQPTVGCIVFLRESSPERAMQRVMAELEAAFPVKCQSRRDNKWLIKAEWGASETDGFLFALENQGQAVVFIEFEEEKSVEIASRREQSLEDVFLPYANALKQMPDVTAVGIGFEMAIPNGFDDDWLEEAGIAVLWERSPSGKGWQRREIYRLIGHTEQPLIGAA